MVLSEKARRIARRMTLGVTTTVAAFLIGTFVVGMNNQTVSAISGTASGGGVNCYTISNITTMKGGVLCAGISVGASYNLWPDARVQLPTTYKGTSKVVVTVVLEQYSNGSWIVRGSQSFDLTSHLKTSSTSWAGGHGHTSGIPGLNYDAGYGSQSYITRVSMKVGSTTAQLNVSRTLKTTIYSPVQYTNFKP